MDRKFIGARQATSDGRQRRGFFMLEMAAKKITVAAKMPGPRRHTDATLVSGKESHALDMITSLVVSMNEVLNRRIAARPVGPRVLEQHLLFTAVVALLDETDDESADELADDAGLEDPRTFGFEASHEPPDQVMIAS